MENKGEGVTQRFCTECQKSFPADAKFCDQCGQETAELTDLTGGGKIANKGLLWKDCSAFRKITILFSPIASLVEMFIYICLSLLFIQWDSIGGKLFAILCAGAACGCVAKFIQRSVKLFGIGKRTIDESVFYDSVGKMQIKLFCYPIGIAVALFLIRIEPFDRVVDLIFRPQVYYTKNTTFDEFDSDIGTMASKLRGEEWRVKKVDKGEYKVYLTGYFRDISEEVEIEFYLEDFGEEWYVTLEEFTLKDSDETYSDIFSVALLLEMLDE